MLNRATRAEQQLDGFERGFCDSVGKRRNIYQTSPVWIGAVGKEPRDQTSVLNAKAATSDQRQYPEAVHRNRSCTY